MIHHRFTLTAVSVYSLLLYGCGGTLLVTNSNTIPITSEPTGATVYVMGGVVGTTPLEVKQSDVFPNVYDTDKKALYGMVQIRKFGCQDFSQLVGASGINAKLVCEAPLSNRVEPVLLKASEPIKTPVPETLKQEAVVPTQKPASTTAKQRLINLNELHEAGLISTEEYRDIRQRILDGL